MTVEEKVKALYKTLLGREPDKSGFNYWVNIAKKKGFNEVVKNFANSEEVKRKLGNKPPQEIIKHVYRNAFGRNPDPSGMKFWFNVARTKSSNPVFLAFAIISGARGNDAERLRMMLKESEHKAISETIQQKVSKPKKEEKHEDISKIISDIMSKAAESNLMTYEQYTNMLKENTSISETQEKQNVMPYMQLQRQQEFKKEDKEKAKKEEGSENIKIVLTAGLGLLALALLLNRR